MQAIPAIVEIRIAPLSALSMFVLLLQFPAVLTGQQFYYVLDYWTLIAARTEDLSDPDKVAVYDKIVKAFQSEGTKKVYEETFGGYYEPAGWDEDLLAPYKNA